MAIYNRSTSSYRASVIFKIYFFAIFCVCCSKNSSQVHPKAPTTCYVTSLTRESSGSSPYSFGYSNDTLMISESMVFSTGVPTPTTITYNNSGQIIKIASTSSPARVEFTYTSGALTSMLWVSSTDVKNLQQNLTYNASGQVEKIVDVYPGNNSPLTVWEFTYPNTTTKNVSVRKKYIPGGPLLASFEYTYDEKSTPFAHGLPPVVGTIILSRLIIGYWSPLFTENNLTKIVEKDATGAVKYNTSLSYVYDSNGYPTKLSVNGSAATGNYTDNVNFIYQCK